MLAIGAPAPAFQLPDQDGNPVSLHDLRGRWVVLYFYPKDDTPGCTIEACEFTAALPAFAGLDAVVLGCSADGASAHQKFIAKYKLGIRLLTDADRAVMQAYGAYGEKMMYGKPVVGVIRSTVLIAPDGVVAYHWPKVKAEGHAEEVRAMLGVLQHGGSAPAAAPKAAKKAGRPAAKKAAKKPARAAKKAKPAKAAKKATKKPTKKAATKPARKAKTSKK